jgi:hypothetical protein
MDGKYETSCAKHVWQAGLDGLDAFWNEFPSYMSMSTAGSMQYMQLSSFIFLVLAINAYGHACACAPVNWHA